MAVALASPFKAHFVTLAKYHRWAYQRLFASVDLLSDEQTRADHGLAFKSVLGTLNHLLLADSLWYMRFCGLEEVGGLKRTEISTFWNGPDDAWTDITESVAAVKPRILAQCDRWEAFVESLADEDLVGEFEYQNTRGEPFRRVRHPVLDHVFNHGTHHRGQISAIVTRLGQPAPAMDLLYYLAEDA